jgi:hypothetical protein
MQNQQQMQQSANAGNPAASGAQQTLNSGGGTAGDILNSGAGQTALGQQTVGFGNMLAGQTADNIRNILTTFTTTIATQGAGQVISQLWPTGGGSGGTAGGSGGSGGGSGGTGGATTTGGGAAGGGSGGGGSGGGGGQPPKPPDGGVAGTNATAGGATTNATGGGTTTTTTGSSNLTYYKLICEMCGKKIYMSDDGTTGSPGNCQNCGHSPLGYQAIGSTRPADYGSASPSFTAYKWTYPCDANVPGTDPKYLPCHKPQVRYYLYTPMSPNGRCPNCGWASTIQSTPF